MKTYSRPAFAAVMSALAASVLIMATRVQAEEANPVFIASYVEVQPMAADEAAGAVRALRDGASKAAGNLRAEALQRTSRKGQFVLLTAWKDQGALDAYLAAAPTQAAREKIRTLRVSPQDDRVHVPLSVGALDSASSPQGVHVVTHVDVIPPRKDDAVGLLKALAEASRRENGNQRYDVVQQVNRPNHFTVTEVWSDEQAFAAHSAAAHVRDFRDHLAPMSGALYDERLYRGLE